MNQLSGGVTAAQGFLAAGIHCGIRKNAHKKDLALIYSKVPCTAAAVYTRNKVKAAPIYVTQEHLADGRAQAVICNSGNANTCNADGMEKARLMCEAAAKRLGIGEKDVVVASTGVIGQPRPIEPILEGMEVLASSLSEDGGESCAEAILTTDTVKKEAAVSFTVGGKTCVLGGCAKGSGMIHPNLATMLVFLTTDCAVSAPLLQKALKADAEDTFNMISVDGDTSTNDTVAILANGMAGNAPIKEEGPDFTAFQEALRQVMVQLCKAIAGDGEGATRLLECNVAGAPTKELAKLIAKSVITSSLVKTAMFGADANWGRILCAIGYADADFDCSKVDVSLRSCKGSIDVCKGSAGLPFSEERAKEILLEKEIAMDVNMNLGEASATAWGCDLTYDYVRINGDYRS